jgi:DNA-3-methyladenine glycosylase
LPDAFALPGPAERRRILARLLRPAPEAARALLGHVLVRRRGRRVVRARIVEAEAYLPARDPAAHVFRGRTRRVEPLFGPPGNVYVYFVYGMHHCLNLAADRKGVPGSVLIRAVELLGGDDPDAGRGPGRLCRALDLTVRDSGQNLFAEGTAITLREGREPKRVGRTRRVGINVAAERVLRFFDALSPAVSGPRAKRMGGVRGAARHW